MIRVVSIAMADLLLHDAFMKFGILDGIKSEPASKLQAVFVDTDAHLLLDHLVACVAEWKINQGRIHCVKADAGEIGQHILLVECSALLDRARC